MLTTVSHVGFVRPRCLADFANAFPTLLAIEIAKTELQLGGIARDFRVKLIDSVLESRFAGPEQWFRTCTFRFDHCQEYGRSAIIDFPAFRKLGPDGDGQFTRFEDKSATEWNIN